MNKVALITGSARRIGRSVALHMAGSGWDLALHYHHSHDRAIELVHQLERDYPEQRFHLFPADLVNTTELEQLIPSVMARFGRLDLLINNASVFEPSSLRESTSELFDRQWLTNLYAPVTLMRDFAKCSGKGLIINFTDTRIVKNESDYFAYTLSKKSLWEATRMAALELAPDIRVNALALGAILPPEGKDEGYLETIVLQSPMKTVPGIESVLESIDYILGNKSLTGQLIFCDGGSNLL